MFGLKEDDFATASVICWYEHALAFNVFVSLSTQWRVGMAGPTGLDYNVLTSFYLKAFGVTLKEWPDLLKDLRVLEIAALEKMNESNKK